MKKSIILVGILTMLISYSCSNDFDLIEDWEDIPVVYGLLSRADTAHYIRVEKAFVDPSTSALDLAQIPDSLYYESIGVSVEHVNSGTIYQLEKVDGNLEGYQREEGIFANAPNYLYKFKLPTNEKLVGGTTYKLSLNRGDNLPEVTATTIVVDDLSIAQPTETLKFEADRSTNFRWATGGSAVFFDLTLRLNYLENSVDNPNIFLEKELLWSVAKNIPKDPNQNFGFYSLDDGNDFFKFIAFELRDAGNLIRDFKNIDVIVNGGDQNLNDYINIGQANIGITSAQEIPTFTNLSEGIGIFGSKNTSILEEITLNTVTEDSLRSGIYTQFLNFQ